MREDIEQSRMRVNRRRALGLGGTIGLGALLAACAPNRDGATGGASTEPATPTPTATDGNAIAPTTASGADLVAKLDTIGACRLTPEETQGPYYFDVDAIRSDIREGRPGTPVTLALRVYDASCTPIPNSVVEIWHCDAGGVYSGFEVASGGGAPGGLSGGDVSDGSYSSGVNESTPADDGTYLRGAQVADSNGIVQFQTIWPGWYRGRTVHIHLKAHVDKVNVLTSQLYFDDALNDAVFATVPYDAHPGRDTSNDTDGIYEPSALLAVEQASTGYLAYANLGIEL
ncbi:intradiol ring-cleavage dioxygenase [Luethyella okanaganae]|uniref:Intradiol ring-cleavage dioxygenase n=1 Tax=Luethyella okanaganae TaxID=69372 RepID=A0ABW1VEZ4_9MICO